MVARGIEWRRIVIVHCIMKGTRAFFLVLVCGKQRGRGEVIKKSWYSNGASLFLGAHVRCKEYLVR
jgi:hypothetical protein